MKLTLHEVAKVVGAKNTISEFDDVPLRQIEFDSRKIEKGDLFLPLKGARDGHDFIETAFENGAVATFSERKVEGHPYILVDDCLQAFQELGYYLEKQRADVMQLLVQTVNNDKRYDCGCFINRIQNYMTHETITMKLVCLTQLFTCPMTLRRLFLKWDKITWAIFIFYQNLLNLYRCCDIDW